MVFACSVRNGALMGRELGAVAGAAVGRCRPEACEEGGELWALKQAIQRLPIRTPSSEGMDGAVEAARGAAEALRRRYGVHKPRLDMGRAGEGAKGGAGGGGGGAVVDMDF